MASVSQYAFCFGPYDSNAPACAKDGQVAIRGIRRFNASLTMRPSWGPAHATLANTTASAFAALAAAKKSGIASGPGAEMPITCTPSTDAAVTMLLLGSRTG